MLFQHHDRSTHLPSHGVDIHTSGQGLGGIGMAQAIQGTDLIGLEVTQ